MLIEASFINNSFIIYLYNNKVSKLTQVQKQQLKDLVLDATVRRLTNLEMTEYVQNKMGITISQDYLAHVKTSIKKDRKQTFEELRKDRYLFINSIFFDRVEELRYMQKVLHQVIETNEDDGDIQIKAVVQLQSITNQLSQYHIALPNVAKYEVADINTLFPPNNNINNNSSNTSAVVVDNNGNNNNNNNGSWWCTHGCNVYHKNEFGHHCPEFACGAEGEDKPGYFGGTPDDQRQF
jgi:hypothetical protein